MPVRSKTLRLPTFATSSTLGCAEALESAARASPRAADCSKWLLELAPKSQLARNNADGKEHEDEHDDDIQDEDKEKYEEEDDGNG